MKTPVLPVTLPILSPQQIIRLLPSIDCLCTTNPALESYSKAQPDARFNRPANRLAPGMRSKGED